MITPSNKATKAYNLLKGLITSGHFAVSERVTEVKVASLRGLSCGLVRESILRLEAEGTLVRNGNRKSRLVRVMDDQNPSDLLARYELREYIEGAAARLAAKHMNGWQIDHLRELCHAIDESHANDAPDRRYLATVEFHQYLVANCGTQLMCQIWEANNLAPVRPSTVDFEREILLLIPIEQRDNPSLADVIEAIASHDPDEAEKRSRQRIRKIADALRKCRWATGSSEWKPSAVVCT
jgi:DNA-binding GntR family transcriptional regulator